MYRKKVKGKFGRAAEFPLPYVGEGWGGVGKPEM